VRKSKMLIPKIKKTISAFLVSEKGKITRSALLKLGMLGTFASMASVAVKAGCNDPYEERLDRVEGWGGNYDRTDMGWTHDNDDDGSCLINNETCKITCESSLRGDITRGVIVHAHREGGAEDASYHPKEECFDEQGDFVTVDDSKRSEDHKWVEGHADFNDLAPLTHKNELALEHVGTELKATHKHDLANECSNGEQWLEFRAHAKPGHARCWCKIYRVEEDGDDILMNYFRSHRDDFGD
jgi:hypothetical protein